MSLLNQKTINKKITVSGIGLHFGKNVNLKILPSKENTGIVFLRSDLGKDNVVIPHFNNVSDTTLCTTIQNSSGVKVSTIEHLMAAFYGLGVDNAIIEIDQDEVPIMDGSSKNFVESIHSIGLKESDTPIKLIKILNKVIIEDGNKFISIEPSKTSLEIDFEIKFKNELIGTQRNLVSVYDDNLEDILSSRTFCLFEDIEKLKEMNLAKGGSLDNAIVVRGTKILNKEKLRNEKEFVNHKILDCIGDLFTSGYRIVGSVYCSKGGHFLTNELLRKVFKNSENFSIIEIKERNLPHNLINRSLLKSIA